jgi:hypothetical protein
MSDKSESVVTDKLPVEQPERKPDEPPAAGEQPVNNNEADSPKKLSKKDSARKSTSPKSKSPTTPRRTKSKDKTKHSSDSDSEGEELIEAEDLGASTGSTAGQSEIFDAGKITKSTFINNFRRILLYLCSFLNQTDLICNYKL